MRSSAAVSGSASPRPDRRTSGCAARTCRAAAISCSVNGSGRSCVAVLDQVAGHLRSGGDDGVEEAVPRGRHAAPRPRCRRSRVAAARWRRRPAVSGAPARAAASGSPSDAACRCPARRGDRRQASAILASSRPRRAAGSPLASSAGGVQVAERQAQQRLQLIGPGQQHRPGPGPGPAGPPRRWPARRGPARGRPRSRPGPAAPGTQRRAAAARISTAPAR